MVDHVRLNNALTKFRANQVSDWSQRGRNDVGGGICTGMCLDWIRRIMHRKGSFGTLEAPRSHIYNPADHIWPYSAYKKEKTFGKQILSNKIATESAHASNKTVFEPALDVLAREFINDNGRPPTEVEEISLTLHWYRCNQPTVKKNAYYQFRGDWNWGTSKGGAEGFFNSEVSFRKNNYMNIHIDTSVMARYGGDGDEVMTGAKIYKDYIHQSIDMLADKGSCGILNVEPGNRSLGHDMAFNVPATGIDFYFFDPNLGEFRFNKDRKAFSEFWVEIWDSVYLEKKFVSAFMSRFYWEST